MKRFSAFILFLVSSLLVFSQNFTGRITGIQGEALNATIYIKQLSQGLTSNDDGYYQTTLATGTYDVEYRSLGYISQTKQVTVDKSRITTIDISLSENPFTLSEVEVFNEEDPAYEIIRKAIAKAPIYAKGVEEYTADVYIKGNGEILKVAGIVDFFAKKEEGVKLSDLKNQVFVQESYNQVKYTSPDKYQQTVKAFSSSFPDDMDSKNATGIINMSLYLPKILNFISPLHPDAFTYYKFRYEGYSEENGEIVNKIKLIPRYKDPILLNGYIYIADNSWHIYYADFESNMMGMKEKYKIDCQKVGENAYLPINYIIDANLSMLGNEFNFSYYAFLTYTNIKIGDGVAKDLKEPKKRKKRDFEIKKLSDGYIVISDSLASKRDSLYWVSIRSIPMEERELISFTNKDSIQQHLDSARNKHRNSSFHPMNILVGGSIGNDSTTLKIKYDGLLRAVPHYNFADGFSLGQSFNLTSRLSQSSKLEISPYLYYTTARKQLIGGATAKLFYSPMKRGELELSANSTSADYNTEEMQHLINSLSSLIRGRNYNYFYHKENFLISNKIDLANGLQLATEFEIAKRKGLENKTSYTWGKKSRIRENMFGNDRFDRTFYSVELVYQPNAYYRIIGGKKIHEAFGSPTFNLTYSEAFSSWQTNNSKFRKLEGGIFQNLKLTEFDNIGYSVSGGGFLGRKQLHFADYQHFDASDISIGFNSPISSFMLLNSYIASANKYWAQSHVYYSSQYLFLKRLPFLQGKMFSEAVHLHTLYTPILKPYTELGYSVNLVVFLSVGAFVSFEKAKYQDFGFSVSLDLGKVKRKF